MSISASSTLVERDPARLLRTALRIDALASGLIGLVLLIDSAPLSRLLNLPASLLLGAGAVLAVYAVGLVWLQRSARLSRPAAWTVVVLNALWLVASIGLLLVGWIKPNLLGVAFVIAQAAAVLVFAEMQYFGLKRLR